MTLRSSFQPGLQQSLEASRYFMTLAADLLNDHLPPMDPKQFLVTRNSQETIPLRIWAGGNMTDDHILELLPWVRAAKDGIITLEHRSVPEEEVERIVWSWATTRRTGETFFIEMLNPAHAFTPDENNELSVGVIGGETVMVSARNVMYVKLGPGVFGLSVARKGSYLFEHIGREELSAVHLRRA